MNELYICGCSYSSGFYFTGSDESPHGRTKSYGEILSESLQLTPVIMASPSASNYAIAKQIEYSIKQNPKFILINLTAPLRFDWNFYNEPLGRPPTSEDFIYWCNDFPKGRKIRPVLNSAGINMILTRSPDKKLIEFLVTYLDIDIKTDQDRLMLAGIFSQLEKTNTKFIALDFSGFYCDANLFHSLPVFESTPTWKTIFQQYPAVTDKHHFSPAGHQLIATIIEPEVRALLDIDK